MVRMSSSGERLPKLIHSRNDCQNKFSWRNDCQNEVTGAGGMLAHLWNHAKMNSAGGTITKINSLWE